MISPECIGLDLGAILDAINRAKSRAPRPSIPSIPRITLPSKPSMPRMAAPRILRTSASNDGRTTRRHIPVGSGPHTVGVVDVMSSHSVHGTFMRIFYPTESTDIFERQLQWPLWLPRKQYIEGYMLFREMNRKLFRLFKWLGGDVYIPALWQAPLLKQQGDFPVIVFSHGIGANRTTYSTVCLDLASHGFVVASVEHRDGSASMTYCLNKQARYYDSHPHLGDIDDRLVPATHDAPANHAEQWLRYIKYPVLDDFEIRNKQVHHRVKEVSRAIDLLELMNAGEKVSNVLGLRFNLAQFASRLDMSKVSIVGHSFGGATTVEALAYEPRIQVGVALDSWMLPIEESAYEKIDRPLLFINTETFQWKGNVLDMLKANVNCQEDRVLITLKGTCHQSQTDFQFLVSQLLGKFLELRHSLSPQVAMDLNNKATRGFLFKHLGLEGTEDSYHEDILSGNHPSVILGSDKLD